MNPMFDWLTRHQELVAVTSDIGTLLIWLIYAQLLYLSFRRQRSPRLIINRGRNKDINALCIISNMSAEAFFIEYIIVELKTSQGTITLDVTDLEQQYTKADEQQNDDQPNTVPSVPKLCDNTRQGPVNSGGFLHIGTFHELLQRIARDGGIKMDGAVPVGDLKFTRLTLRLIGIYGPERMPVGAERSFRLTADPTNHQCDLSPDSWNTRQLSSLWQRHKLRKNVEHMNATNFVSSSSLYQAYHKDNIHTRAKDK